MLCNIKNYYPKTSAKVVQIIELSIIFFKKKSLFTFIKQKFLPYEQ